MKPLFRQANHRPQLLPDFLTADDLPILGCVPTAEAVQSAARRSNRPVSEVQPGSRAADAIEGFWTRWRRCCNGEDSEGGLRHQQQLFN